MKKVLLNILLIVVVLLVSINAFADTCSKSLMPAFTAAQAGRICAVLASNNGVSARFSKVGAGITPSYLFHSNGTGTAAGAVLFNNNSSGDADSGVRIDSRVATTHYNWSIGAQLNSSASVEITPSTAVGGTTFSTPSLLINQNGNITFPGNVISSSSGGTLSLQEATAGSKCMGSVTFNGTTAVTVSTTCAVTSARIFLTPTSDPTGATAAYCWVTNIVNATSFDVDCDQANDGTANWFIIKESA